MSRRVLLGVAGAAIALLASAPAASAAQLFAVPTGGSTVSNCQAANPPCTLERALETVAVDGDEVIVNPGTYNEVSEPAIDADIVVHGVAGQPRPMIVSPGDGLDMTAVDAAGASVRYLRLTAPVGIRIAVPATIDQVIAQGTSAAGCLVLPAATLNVTLSNSVCRGVSGNRGIDYESSSAITDTLALRNVSAFVPNTGNGILALAGTGANLTVDAKNVIADGATDVATTGDGTATVNLSFSNYVTSSDGAAGGLITDPTMSNNQMTPPVFADADLHQAASSQTINAGSAVDISGAFDVDGDMRTVGSAPDIGADEFVPLAASTASPPSNAFTVGELNGKKLTLDLPSAGTVDMTDAGAQAGAGGASAAAKKFLKPASASGGPGTVTVTLKLTKAAKQKLRLKGKVRVNARITFTPSGGTAASQTTRLKIRR